MKKVLTNFMTLGGISLLLLASCKKNDPVVKISGNGTAGTLAANQTTLVLDKAKVTDTSKVIMFNFTKPVYGYSAAVTNTLQIDAPGDNWAHPATTTLGVKAASQGFSTPDFNALLLKLNLPAGVASQVQVRVQHSLGAGAEPIYSNVLNMTVTPFNLTTWIWVTGQFSGWANTKDPSAEDSLVSVTGNGIYTGIINFPATQNQFLIIPVKGSWDHKFATNDAEGSTSSTVTYDAPHNLYAPAAGGQLMVTFNSNTGTITFAAANYYSAIGSAPPGGDWNTDTDLKFVNDGTNTWAGVIPMTAGEFKVRQNHDWGLSWGIPKEDGEGVGVAGTLNDTKNNNIPIATAGNYKVTFTIPVTVVGGAAPPVLATYTVTKQ